MDRRIHNAIKLSAAVFLLNACGYGALKNEKAADKAKSDTPQHSQQEVQTFLTPAVTMEPDANCYELSKDPGPIVVEADDSGDLFRYTNFGTMRQDPRVSISGAQTSEVISKKGSCS